MAIPTYKREKVKVDTTQDRFTTAPGQAEAQAQRGVMQASQQVSNQLGQRTRLYDGQEARMHTQNLTQKLQQFTAQVDAYMGSTARQLGQEHGIKDIAKTREEIIGIRQKYANNPEVMQQKIEEVTTGEANDMFSVYGTVYKDTALTAYANQVEVDAANFNGQAINESRGDPEVYKKSYQAYANAIANDAPNELGAIAARSAFEKRGARTYQELNADKFTNIQKQHEENVKGNIKGLTDLISSSSSKGRELETKSYSAQLAALVQAEVDAGRMAPYEAKGLMEETFTTIQTNEFMRFGGEAVNSGNGYDFMRKIQNPEHPYGKAFAALPAETQSKVLSETKSAINAYETAESGVVDHENKIVSALQKKNTREMGNDIISNGKRFTQDELRARVLAGTITEKDKKKIESMQDATTDSAMLMRYGSNSTLVTMEEDDIKALENISVDDKLKLLNKRETAMNSPLYEWTKSVNGKEAIKSLAEDYGVAVNPIFDLPGKPDKNRVAYNEKRKELFRRTQALPFEDREKKVLDIYKDITTEFKEKDDVQKKEKKENKDAVDYNKMREEIQKKNAETFRFKEYTVENYANDNSHTTKVRADRLTEKYGDPMKAKKPALVKPTPKPMTIYKPPKPAVSSRMGSIAGYEPRITGKNVDLRNVRTSVKDAAYPILKKYNLGVKDGFRATPGGGAKKSQHLDGNAIDVTWAGKSTAEKIEIIKDFKAAGFRGFGIGENTIHIDRRKNPASWSYIGGSATGGGWMPKWAAQALRS